MAEPTPGTASPGSQRHILQTALAQPGLAGCLSMKKRRGAPNKNAACAFVTFDVARAAAATSSLEKTPRTRAAISRCEATQDRFKRTQPASYCAALAKLQR